VPMSTGPGSSCTRPATDCVTDRSQPATSHHNANVLVTFEGADKATMRTSVYAWHEQADGVTPRLWGYYHDSVARGPDGWHCNTTAPSPRGRELAFELASGA
jgi:hypothetical protein